MRTKILKKLIKVSKYTLLGLLVQSMVFTILLASNSDAQNTKVNKSVDNVQLKVNVEGLSVQEIFSLIENKTDFRFAYRKSDINVKADFENEAEINTVGDILRSISQTTGLEFRRVNEVIHVKKCSGKEECGVSEVIQLPQAKTIIGTVTSAEDGSGIPGVNVLIKGTSTGTVTDMDGNYKLEVPSEDAVLVFSSVAYISKEIRVGSQDVINVVLEPDVTSLEEIVVIGYGEMKKSDYTGAVSSIDNEKITERPSLNLSQAMSSRVAGLHVQTNSGRPGGNIKTVIRGYNSFNASNEPLYVVDGIIWPDGIEALNPYDVERIDVLKDASATAIYGTRGSNGVIMITTKKGEEGSHVRYDGWAGVNWLPQDRKLDVLNSKEFMFIEEEQYKNAQKFDPDGWANGIYTDPVVKRMDYLVGNSLGNRELFELDENGVPQPIYDIDWQDMSTRRSISQGHNLSFTGGSELSNYGLFLGYIDEEGILKRSFAKKFNVRAVTDQRMTEWLKVGGTITFARMNEEGLDDRNTWNITRDLIETVTFIPYKYEDGEYGYAGDYQGLEKVDNPLAKINENDWVYTTNRFGGNVYAAIQIIPDLEFTSTAGVNTTTQKNIWYRSSRLRRRSANQTTITNIDEEFFQWSNRLNYDKQFNENHSIAALAGIEMQSYNYFNSRIDARDGDNYFKWYNLSSMTDQRASRSHATDYTMLSYFGRLNYNFKERYLLTVTGRFDGSSRFGKDNKFAFFPSSAIAWRISEEDFLINDDFISDLKLRVSYGLTGNSDIGSYRSLANLGTKSYIFQGTRVTGAAIDRLANPLLQWEKTSEFNVGIDVGIINNRISLSTEYYENNTTDLLFDAPVPSTSGYTTVTKNIGSMESKGVEITLNTVNIDNGAFSWSSNFNLSTVNNTVTALGDENEDILYGFKDALILRVGEAAGSFFGYERDGVYGTDDAAEAAEYGKLPGDVRTVDQNNDGVINFADRVIIGKGQPDFYGGFSNTFTYNGFDLVVELQFWEGNDVFNNGFNSGEARQGIANSFATVLDAWTPDNQDAVLEQVRPTKAYYTYNMDTRNVWDGSFIRGKNLSLGYTLPASLASRWGLNNLRIFTSAQNFFILTEYIGYDPESSNNYHDDPISQGVSYDPYPRPRSFMLGVNVGL